MLRDYLKVLRLDHWFKNIFIVIGLLAAWVYFDLTFSFGLFWQSLLAFLLASLTASGNYIMNEIVDAKFDRQHPVKCQRPIPAGKVKVNNLKIIALLLWAVSLTVGGLVFGRYLFWVLLFFVISAVVYNLKPIRTKDLPYFDVGIEALGNPIRLLIGWFALGATQFPPFILLFSFWAIGGFLMTSKRFTELRFLDNREMAINYRPVFKFYSQESLLIAMIIYLSVFSSTYTWLALEYQFKLLYLSPLILVFMVWFFHLLFEKDSIAKEPEKLITKPWFVVFCLLILLCLFIILLT